MEKHLIEIISIEVECLWAKFKKKISAGYLIF